MSSAPTSRRTRRPATGPTTTTTPGSATTTGAGPRSTTVAGCTRTPTAGAGSRAVRTPAPGSTGATATATMATSAVGLGFVPRVAYGFVGCNDLFQTGLRGRMVGGSQVGTVASHTRPYQGASPTVNGRVAANRRVNGPPPSMLGIPTNAIAHGGVANRGVVQ